MTSLRQGSGQDYPAASRKHCRDARVLLDNRCFDGAAYLSGYAVECTLKTLIQVDNKHTKPKITHDLEKLSKEVLDLMMLPDSRTARYFDVLKQKKIPYDEPPRGWRETLRYYPEGTIPAPTAGDWVADAERLYEDVIGGLLKDGEVNL